MNHMRISGLASGMDTDLMVENMMRVERMKVDRVEQNKQVAMWRQTAYNDMNKTFANFILNSKKDIGLANTSSTGSLSFSNYKRLNYIRKVSSSNEIAATVSSTSKTLNGSYTIDIKKMAKGANFTSANMSQYDFSDVKEMAFSINGQTVKVTGKENKDGTIKDITMNDVSSAINSVKIKTADDKEIGLGVTAFYDDANGRLFLQTTEIGGNAKIELDIVGENDTEGITEEEIAAGNIFIGEGGLGYIDINKGSYTDKDAKYMESQDAIVEFNGVELNYDKNNIELNGLNIQLRSEGMTTINVDTNVDGIMEKIEKLIEDYNELVDKASAAVGEKRYASYHPLSQEEKRAMHEDDVKLWEEKAKSGMLNRDETINRTLQNVRNELYKTLEGHTGSFKHITEIGITTEEYSRGSAGGKLQINKETLREAILDDPEGVMELLFTENNEEPSESKYSTDGVFTRVYDSLIDGMKSIVDKSGPGEDSDLLRNVKFNILIDFVTKKSSISDLDKQVLDMDRKISNLNIILARKEQAHYAKFTAMEKYMHQMNSQSNWLMQQFM